MNNNSTDVEKLASMIKDFKIAMLTTVSEDGSIHSRPMVTQKFDVSSFNGTLWFFSKRSSPKNHSIENDQHVNLAYVNMEDQKYISVCGRATISTDKQKMKELWSPMLKAWFPEGLEDPEISLISVAVESAEIWDSPPSSVVHLAGFLKSAVTGKPYSQNANSQHVDLQSRH